MGATTGISIIFEANSTRTGGTTILTTDAPAYLLLEGAELYVYTAADEFVFNANCQQMFGEMSNTQIVSINFGNDINTENVKNMNSMFSNNLGLTTIVWGNNFKTTSVDNMSTMFGGCTVITSLDLSGFDFTNEIDYKYMFYDTGKNVPSENPIKIYVKSNEDKTILEAASTYINEDYATIEVKL